MIEDPVQCRLVYLVCVCVCVCVCVGVGVGVCVGVCVGVILFSDTVINSLYCGEIVLYKLILIGIIIIIILGILILICISFLNSQQIESQCSNIPVGVSILILHARTGSTSLPSSQVYGVHTVYQTETICLGSGCGPIPKPIPMHTRISYVDLTQGPAEVLKSITDIQGQLPEDFFYPFFVASNSHSTFTHNVFTAYLVATFCLLCTLYIVF